MNTIRSTWIGWGSLIVAGGGAYYFAKRSVNADKRARHEEDMKLRRRKDSLEAESYSRPSVVEHKKRKTYDHAASPSTEASVAPDPTGHAAANSGSKSQEENKYLPSKPYRTRKGDRFS